MRAFDGNAPANLNFEYALFRVSEPI
jgi:hypothetical protein